MKLQIGKVYRIHWFDPGIVPNTESKEVSPNDFTDFIGTIQGAEYRGLIRVENVRVCLFYSCTFPKKEHEDYYFIPEGCIIRAVKIKEYP